METPGTCEVSANFQERAGLVMLLLELLDPLALEQRRAVALQLGLPGLGVRAFAKLTKIARSPKPNR